jgi:predicted lysophospholipase L1 biosynthesis ABC-type transport system permease subunit
VGYAVATAVLAAVVASAVLVLLPTIIDATAVIPPLTRPRPDLADVAVLAGVLVATVLVAWLLGSWRARHRHPAEVLRAG